MIIYIWFLGSVYHHLNTYFVIIQLSNEALAKDKGKYPFDIIFSVPFDNILFTIKILVGIEYNYTASKQVIDLFAGVGGLSYGFAHNDNFQIVMANEYDKDIATAYRMNHPTVDMIQGDIRNLTEEELKKHVGNGIDLIVGGPPCQSYSTLGKRQMDDRAHLFEEYCRVLSIVQPKAFVFENVSGLLSMQGGTLIEVIKEKFRELGYDVKSKVLNAVDFGVPQYRDRVILVGMKGKNTFEYPTPTHGEGLLPYVTVEDAFSDLSALKSGQESTQYATEPQNEFQKYLRTNSDCLTENIAPTNGAHLIRIMEALPDGGSKDDLPLFA